jgi:TonB family protein
MSTQRTERASSLSRAALALACVALLTAAADARHAATTPHASPTAAPNARASKGPLTKSYLLGALRRGRPKKSELVRLVKRRGVSFELTAVDESELRAAGATPALLSAVRAYYSPPHLPVPAAIMADPVLLPPPEVHSVPSGKGVGTGSGGGSGGADRAARPDTFTPGEVTRKAIILYKPQPGFTEEARRNNVSGVVILRVTLAANGEVTNITVVRGLPDGLSEKAITAARQLRFKPAEKDGRAVSQLATIEYNFYLY